MISLKSLMELRDSDRPSFIPEVNDTVAYSLKNDPTISVEALHKDVEDAVEFISIPVEYVEELVGFFKSNPDALDAYLTELHTSRSLNSNISAPLSREAALAFLKA